MRFIVDIAVWALVFFLVLSGAALAAIDGALVAYFRPYFETLIEGLPDFVKWIF